METYFDNMTAPEGSAEKLRHDFRTLLSDTEDLVKDSCRALGQQTKVAARQTDQLIRRNPLVAVGVAFGAGMLLGVLLGRK
jgi:ElaB/YqjD/DUF883 family membrane-anchored ribosome-binding protein